MPSTPTYTSIRRKECRLYLTLALCALAPSMISLPASAVAKGGTPGLLNGSPYADTSFCASGFDTDEDGQPDDFVQLGTEFYPAAPVPNVSGYYLQSAVGGIVASTSSFAGAAQQYINIGDDIMRGTTGTFANPEDDSALRFRRVLYAREGIDALRAFYTNAIQAFTPRLLEFLDAEMEYRIALRTDPYNKFALDGLLETYYARAEGFMLIGNEYRARALGHKFNRGPAETKSIREVELENMDAALTAYTMGFREFFKLFNSTFTYQNRVFPDLGLNADRVFFSRTYPQNGQKIVFESLRGATNAIGESTRAASAAGTPIGPIQGAPSLLLTIPDLKKNVSQESALRGDYDDAIAKRQTKELVDLSVPIKFLVPRLTSSAPLSPGSQFQAAFDFNSTVAVKTIDVLLEFDFEKVNAPAAPADIVPGSGFQLVELQLPGTGNLYANQALVRLTATAPSGVTGSNTELFKATFEVKSNATPGSDFSIYLTGSAGSLLSGYKDLALIFRLASARADSAQDKARRVYVFGDDTSAETALSFLDAEIGEIGTWVAHLEGLLAMGATEPELSGFDALQTARNTAAASISALEAFRSFVREGRNPFGYAPDYVPFFDAPNQATSVSAYDSIREILTAPNGIFDNAIAGETNAIANKDKFEDTRDRIRGEIFTINEQAESRLAQICGRVNKDKPEQPVIGTTSDPIDYELVIAPENSACEIGQAVLQLDLAQLQVNQAKEQLENLNRDVAIRIRALREELEARNDIIDVLNEFSIMQQNLDKEIARVSAKQTLLNASTSAANTIIGGQNWADFITFKNLGAVAQGALTLANGFLQADLEKEKGRLTAEKTRLSYEERIKLTAIDSKIRGINGYAEIETQANDLLQFQISVDIQKINWTSALGRLNALLSERDELLARRGRQLANLGEMSFADPSFRLFQFQAMVDAETSLNLTKNWLYLMTVALQYKWALPLNYVFDVTGTFPELGAKGRVSIADLTRIRVVGKLQSDNRLALQDTLTATDYLHVLQLFDNSAPLFLGLAYTGEQTAANTSGTAKFSLREDYLRNVREGGTPTELAAQLAQVRANFRTWLKSPDRRISDPNDSRGAVGDMVIEFDTMSHLDGYNLPRVLNDEPRPWTHFALRGFSNTNPLWNHKITRVGVALKGFGGPFIGSTTSIGGTLQFGGAGFVKRNSNLPDDFEVYSMQQWINRGSGKLEPVDMRSVPVVIPESGNFESTDAFLTNGLKGRPVSASRWRLIIPKQNVDKLNLDAVEDIIIYVYSEAYQAQK